MTTITHKTAKASLLALWALACGGSPVLAQDLALPKGAKMTREVAQSKGAYALPIGPWTEEGGLPSRRIEGAVNVQSWRIDATGLTSLQLLTPLRDQLREGGFDIEFDCISAACGGFDFRFQTFVLPGPDMYVSLTDYHFIAATGPKGQAISLLASKDQRAGYVQIIRAGDTIGSVRATAKPVAAAVVTNSDFASQLEQTGHAILSDLVFQTGSSSLGDGSAESLDAIADYLTSNPSRRILFVGHTDAVGSLEGNQALSRKRASAAVTYLRDRHNIPAEQIGADGVGYLSPVASNLTPEGRKANRRIEAVLISTE
ncbi:MAG: OmpA family protein [Pelagimonas sp.]|uniref:OmpA family protein n=1 Tax=Pelagimonas sp. TaxID=2073170 RepID=UPI003D6A94FE